jgi:Phosphoribosylanthranilate isomerase
MKRLKQSIGYANIQASLWRKFIFDADEELTDAIDFKTLPVVRAKSIEELDKFKNRYRLIDVYSRAYGGTGDRLDLSWFKNRDCSKMILAGGLTPENLDEIKGFGFYGVDVSSGVEAAKGKKDPKKVAQFIANAKCI